MQRRPLLLVLASLVLLAAGLAVSCSPPPEGHGSGGSGGSGGDAPDSGADAG
jgi:hypothetical protein